MSNSVLDQLNEPQKEAAGTVDRDVRIIAGAGSGKTRTLISRICYLVEECGIWPSRILAITFTNKAAREMKERLADVLQDDAAGVRVSTIHSLCVRMLREDSEALQYPKDFAILDGEDQKSILRPHYKTTEADRNQFPPSRILSFISRMKRENISPNTAQEIAYDADGALMADFYDYYQARLAGMKAMDFDDLLLNGGKLLREHEDIRKKWQNRLDYLHVDEFQDVDEVQYDLIRQLKGDHARLCVVGDPDQTIYTWRGASVDIIMRFDKDFPDCRTIVLNENYRSAQPILNAANALIAHNTDRIKKDLFSRIPGEHLVEEYQAEDDSLEAEMIARKILENHENGVPFHDMAVLYRANFLSRTIENLLRKANIPYSIYGGIRFYERKEIKDMLSYMRLLSRKDPMDEKALSKDLALMRIINEPRRGIGARTIEKLQNAAREQGVNMLEAIGNGSSFTGASRTKLLAFQDMLDTLRQRAEMAPLEEVIDIILDETGYGEALKAEGEDEENPRLANIKELQKDIADALEENPLLTLEEYLQTISLFTDREEKESKDFVSLMTVHAAKGLEFPIVFAAGLNEYIFPSQKAIDENRKGLEEERRLLYVAMTRAKQQLYLSWSLGYSFQSQSGKVPSRFIKEIPDELVCGRKKAEKKKLGSGSTSSFQRHSRRNSRSSTGNTTRFRPGDLIEHSLYGQGVILSINGNTAQIAFGKSIGIKNMNIKHPSLKKISGRSSVV